MTPLAGDAVRARFRDLRLASECRYARGSRFIGVGARNPGEQLVELRAAMWKSSSGTDVRADVVDGVVYEIALFTAGSSITNVSVTVAGVLAGLAALDGRTLTAADVTDPAWWFRCGGSAWFVSVFAPCYPANSSRYNFGSARTRLVFIRAEAFRRRRPPGESELPAEAKRQIRSAFAAAGRPYDLSLTLSPREADRIVKPLACRQPAIAWWENL